MRYACKQRYLHEAGVGYWATNQSCTNLTGMVGAHPPNPISGTLYRCIAANTWDSGASPLPYPHPLRGEGSGSDTTPPSNIATVNDGTGSDINSTTLTAQLLQTGQLLDTESQISGYKYAVGTIAGATNTCWTDDSGTSVTKTSLSLTTGQAYYFSVKAVNGYSLESDAKNSDGVLVESGRYRRTPRRRVLLRKSETNISYGGF